MAQRLSHRCGGDRRALLRTIHGDIEGCFLAVVEVDWFTRASLSTEKALHRVLR
jgi:hypothetical protein